MLPIRLLVLLASALPALGSKADLANCDPLKKDSHAEQGCPPDPAFATNTTFDFAQAAWDADLAAFWSPDPQTAENSAVTFSEVQGAAFSVWGDAQAPTFTSERYLFFGKVSVEAMAAQGAGLVTAIVLKSDSGDEIDWEILGAYENQAQSNYFYDGQALFNTYNNTYLLPSSTFTQFHKYSVEWLPKSLTFSIDDVPLKTWTPGPLPAEKWPQTPMQLKLGVWSVSNASDPGEIAWAGGVPDWSRSPYAGYFRRVELIDYLGLCNRTDGEEIEYQYDERTWGWQDVQIKGCVDREGPGIAPPPPFSTNGLPLATGANGTAGQATQTGGPSPTSTDNEGSAQPIRQLSSPLAAVLLLGWVLLL